jgi:hypothetical protein
MHISGVDITINRSSTFLVEAPDKVQGCLIRVKKSEPGSDHPIVIRSRATFRANTIISEIPEPVLLDTDSGNDFLGVGDNYFKKE